VPKKQHHTARRVWTRLVSEEAAAVAESTVRQAVRRIRAEIAQPEGEAMVPQVHQPGHEAEVDFGEFWALIAGVMVKLWIFFLRLSASGRACHRAFATEAQEAFFVGHIDAFDRIGGVPARVRYDNLKPAVARVLLGRDRSDSEWFVLLRSHYGFDSFYYRPGVEGAHEKGGVEGDIGWFRRNHLVPVPTAASLADLNEMLTHFAQYGLTRVIEGKRATIGVEFATEAPLLSMLPPERFDAAHHVSAQVDTKDPRAKEKVEAEIAASLAPRWVSRVITTILIGETPAALRLQVHTSAKARATMEEEAPRLADPFQRQGHRGSLYRHDRRRVPHPGDRRGALPTDEGSEVSFYPMFHWTEQKIRVHVFCCVLALVVARLMVREADRVGIHLRSASSSPPWRGSKRPCSSTRARRGAPGHGECSPTSTQEHGASTTSSDSTPTLQGAELGTTGRRLKCSRSPARTPARYERARKLTLGNTRRERQVKAMELHAEVRAVVGVAPQGVAPPVQHVADLSGEPCCPRPLL